MYPADVFSACVIDPVITITPRHDSMWVAFNKLNSNHGRKSQFKFKFWNFKHFSAKLGPDTHSNGSGSKNGTERTTN